MGTLTTGNIPWSQNFKVEFGGPLDNRITVDTEADLGSVAYRYKGMLIAVVNDTTASKNGLYLLADIPDPADQTQDVWVKFQEGVDPIASQLIADNTEFNLIDDGNNPAYIQVVIDNTQVATISSAGIDLDPGGLFTIDGKEVAPGHNNTTLRSEDYYNSVGPVYTEYDAFTDFDSGEIIINPLETATGDNIPLWVDTTGITRDTSSFEFYGYQNSPFSVAFTGDIVSAINGNTLVGTSQNPAQLYVGVGQVLKVYGADSGNGFQPHYVLRSL